MAAPNVVSKASRRRRFPEGQGGADGSRPMARRLSAVREVAALAAAALVCGSPARASDSPLRLLNPPPVASEAAAMPRIASPSDPAQRRINAALKRLDANLGKAIRGCNTRTQRS